MRLTSLRALLLAGAAYAVFGVAFGALAGRAGTHLETVAWRWAAWVASSAVFATQIGYEQVRLGSSPARAAWRAACASALGALGLAAAANVHWLRTSPHPRGNAIHLALVAWPIATGLPAFGVAWVVAAMLARLRSKAKP